MSNNPMSNDSPTGQPMPTRADMAQSLAILMLCLAFFVFTAFQTYLLLTARGNLATVRANQEQPLTNSVQLRERIEELARRTASLAEQGNANAASIVENFRRQGVEMKSTRQ